MTRYIENLNECTDPTTGDFLWVVDASAGATDKDRKVNISKVGILANAQSWTATQTHAPTSTSVNAITTNMPSSNTAYAWEGKYNGTTRLAVLTQAATNAFYLSAFDNGSGAGSFFTAERNSNASTPAAGHISLMNRAGTYYYIWPDASGNLRIAASTIPTNANDGAGAVVGTQTSWMGLKDDIEEWNDVQAALDAVLATRLFHYRFKGDTERRQYHGLIISDEDRGAWFSENDAPNQTPVLNERNLFGHLIAAIQAQQVQINELKAKIAELEKKC